MAAIFSNGLNIGAVGIDPVTGLPLPPTSTLATPATAATTAAGASTAAEAAAPTTLGMTGAEAAGIGAALGEAGHLADPNGVGAGSVLGTSAGMAGTGAVFGPVGAAIGGAIGLGLGLLGQKHAQKAQAEQYAQQSANAQKPYLDRAAQAVGGVNFKFAGNRFGGRDQTKLEF